MGYERYSGKNGVYSMNSNMGNIWQLRLPEKFGPPPVRMSITTLLEIESCPRRYALRTATYEDIWNNKGYPPKPTIKSLQGTIFHRSVERIVKSLQHNNCPSNTNGQFIEVMRELKGYSGVLEQQLSVVLGELQNNPRMHRKSTIITDELNTSLFALREQLQSRVTKLTIGGQTSTVNSSKSGLPRAGLPNGFHSEVQLNAPGLEWFGIVDYLRLSNDGCELTDFKTGESKQDHVFQLKIYNLLWALDRNQNPNSVPVSKLLLSYKSGDVEIEPIAPAEMDSFANDVIKRTDSARHQIFQDIPAALPSLDKCRYCSVRQLCSEFWTNEAQNDLNRENLLLPAGKQRNNFDIEIELEKAISPNIWFARSLVSGQIAPHTQLLIRFSSTALPAKVPLTASLKLRLLDANLLESSDEELAVQTINMNWRSEAFVTD